MGTEDKKLVTSIKRATILSGIGMGLLLGIIMGLSVSETVQTIFGVLTTILGAFLGFDKRSYAGMEASEYEKEQHNTLFTALRAGWFGIAVVLGILSGIGIRTQEIFEIPVSKKVKQLTDAGFEPEYARKLIAYWKFAINPKTGELELQPRFSGKVRLPCSAPKTGPPCVVPLIPTTGITTANSQNCLAGTG